MLSLITGTQRSGKSYFCVTLILDYLKTCNRPIYTNLPIHPDRICKFATSNPAKYSSYLRRIHAFKSFRSLGEARAYYKKNPDWCKCHNLLPEALISDYWVHTKPNSIIFLDEIYQWFSAQGFKDKDSAPRRQQLLTYTRQHGHYKDDMFLISHQPEDVDINIRRGVQYLYTLENAKYKNIFSWLWLRGLKYPIQFFLIKGFEYGEKEYSDSWCLYPKKAIFKCYDSFSSAESIPGKALPSEDDKSTDTGVNFWKNLFSFFRQSWIGLVIVIFVIVLIRSFYNFYVDLCKGGGGVSLPVASASAPVSDPVLSSSASDPVQPSANPAYSSPVAVSSSMLIFADGFKIRRGDVFDGFIVKRILKSYVELEKDGVLSRVVVSGLYRVPERTTGEPTATGSGASGNASRAGGYIRR